MNNEFPTPLSSEEKEQLIADDERGDDGRYGGKGKSHRRKQKKTEKSGFGTMDEAHERAVLFDVEKKEVTPEQENRKREVKVSLSKQKEAVQVFEALVDADTNKEKFYRAQINWIHDYIRLAEMYIKDPDSVTDWQLEIAEETIEKGRSAMIQMIQLESEHKEEVTVETTPNDPHEEAVAKIDEALQTKDDDVARAEQNAEDALAAINTELETSSVEEVIPSTKSIDRLMIQVDRLVGHTNRIRTEKGLTYKDASKNSNLNKFAAARSNLVALRKELEIAKNDPNIVDSKRFGDIRSRIAEYMLAMREDLKRTKEPERLSPAKQAEIAEEYDNKLAQDNAEEKRKASTNEVDTVPAVAVGVRSRTSAEEIVDGAPDHSPYPTEGLEAYDGLRRRWLEARKESTSVEKKYNTEYRDHLSSLESKKWWQGGLTHRFRGMFGLQPELTPELEQLKLRSQETRAQYKNSSETLMTMKEVRSGRSHTDIIKIHERYQRMLAHKLAIGVSKERLSIQEEELGKSWKESNLSKVSHWLKKTRYGRIAATAVGYSVLGAGGGLAVAAAAGSGYLARVGIGMLGGVGAGVGTAKIGERLYTGPKRAELAFAEENATKNFFELDFATVEQQYDGALNAVWSSEERVKTAAKTAAAIAGFEAASLYGDFTEHGGTATNVEASANREESGEFDESELDQNLKPTPEQGSVLRGDPDLYEAPSHTPNDIEKSPPTTPEIEKPSEPPMEKTPEQPVPEIEPLGTYSAVKGDNFWNYVEGQTGAPKIPAFESMKDSPHYQALIDLVRDIGDSDPKISHILGFGDSMDDLTVGSKVDLDMLNAIANSIIEEKGWSDGSRIVPAPHPDQIPDVDYLTRAVRSFSA